MITVITIPETIQYRTAKRPQGKKCHIEYEQLINVDFFRKTTSSTSDMGDDYGCEHRGTELIVFDNHIERKIQKGKCLCM